MTNGTLPTLSIAVISDLHIGRARAVDLYPTGTDHDDSVIDQAYIPDFIRFVENNQLRADYLVVPGDVANSGQAVQLKLGSEALLRCAEALGVPEERIVFVPGNHDVDWNVLRLEDPTGHYHSLRFAPLENRDLLFQRCIGRATQSLTESPYYSIWEFEDLLVVGYNSAWDDGPNATVKHGVIDQSHLDRIAADLASKPQNPSQLRVFVIHHHPVQYPDPTQWKDFSELQNAAGLFSLLWEHDFDLVIHGHRHHPFVTRQSHGLGRYIPILCAGSFSAILYPGWRNQIGNQFHIVDVAGRASLGGSVEGHIRSWTYLTGRGWCESRSGYTGIAHIEGFGAYFETEHLIEAVRLPIENMVAEQGFARWSSLAQSNPAFGRIANRQVKIALDRLAGEVGLDVIVTDSEEFVLLRKKN